MTRKEQGSNLVGIRNGFDGGSFVLFLFFFFYMHDVAGILLLLILVFCFFGGGTLLHWVEIKCYD